MPLWLLAQSSSHKLHEVLMVDWFIYSSTYSKPTPQFRYKWLKGSAIALLCSSPISSHYLRIKGPLKQTSAANHNVSTVPRELEVRPPISATRCCTSKWPPSAGTRAQEYRRQPSGAASSCLLDYTLSPFEGSTITFVLRNWVFPTLDVSESHRVE
jgi:hypothetical protein